MPPKKWMTAAPGAEALVMPRPKTVYASRIPSPGPGLVSTIKSMDLPASLACSMASGARTPWFMALFRKSTFAGSTMMLTSGRRPAFTTALTPAPRTSPMAGIKGPAPRTATGAGGRRRPARRGRLAAGPEDVADGGDNGAGAENADDGEGAADDAGGEGVHQHLEALANPTLHEAVELHDDVTAQRSHDERAEEHRDVGTDDNADGGDRADHAAPHVVDHPPAGVGDQERQQVEDHGIDEFCRRLVRDPPVRDEERRDQTPRDERPEVGHHAR